MLLKRAASLVASASMALATAVAIAPAAAAQTETVTETVSYTYQCRGNNAGNAPGSPRDVTVTYPDFVAPGEVFTVLLEPGTMRNNSRNHARFTYDVALPDNAQVIDYSLVGGAMNMGGNPALVRVNPETKVNQPDGDALRIWGGQSARWGTNPGAGTSGGLTVSSNRDFRFPAVEMTFRAPAEPGAEISVGLAGTGPNNSAAGAQLMYSGNAWFQDFQNECAASANAAQLTTTTVSDAEYAVLESNTRIIGGDQLVDTSEPFTLRAQVASPYAPAANLSQGEVTFRDVTNDRVLGTANPGPDGLAEVMYEFDRIPDDDPDVPITVVAEYSGFEGNAIQETIAPSSDSVELTLTPKPVVQWVTDFNVQATVGELTDDAQRVTITTTFQRPGREYPEGTVVQLYRNGVAVGEPVPMPETGTTLTWQDEIPREERNATYRYTVELETIRVDYDQWTGSAAQPAAVIVRGTDDTLPGPTEPGSLEMGSADLGALSSDLVGYDVAPLSAVLPELSTSMS